MPQTASKVRLKQQTLKSFEAYVRDAEAGMERTLTKDGLSLWSSASPDKAQQIRTGELVAQFSSGYGPLKVPSGLIHDWIGAAWTPDTTVAATIALVQNYDNHKNIYKPEVIESKLIRRDGNEFRICLRLLKKKILSVVLDTDHSVKYRRISGGRWACWSYTTRSAEVEHAGSANEEILPPDSGYGFLWRLNSYWRFEERDGGVYLECRAISLTRDVPLGLGWIIEPIIEKLPKESLMRTLECTRQALLVEAS